LPGGLPVELIQYGARSGRIVSNPMRHVRAILAVNRNYTQDRTKILVHIGALCQPSWGETFLAGAWAGWRGWGASRRLGATFEAQTYRNARSLLEVRVKGHPGRGAGERGGPDNSCPRPKVKIPIQRICPSPDFLSARERVPEARNVRKRGGASGAVFEEREMGGSDEARDVRHIFAGKRHNANQRREWRPLPTHRLAVIRTPTKVANSGRISRNARRVPTSKRSAKKQAAVRRWRHSFRGDIQMDT